MTDPEVIPPSQPQNVPAILQGVDIKKWATMYAQYYGMLSMIGLKLPKELHDMLIGIASADNPQLRATLPTQDAVPENPIAEPVLTRRLAGIAYQMHMEGASLADISEEFTKEGNPVSRATVARWINQYEDENQFERKAHIARIRKWLIVTGIFALTIIITHVVWH